jgi:hypothetical protein
VSLKCTSASPGLGIASCRSAIGDAKYRIRCITYVSEPVSKDQSIGSSPSKLRPPRLVGSYRTNDRQKEALMIASAGRRWPPFSG